MSDGLRDYFDISPKLSNKLAVFPGDQLFARTVALSFEEGHHLALSAITTTLHIGAHADAPSHYHRDGQTIEGRDLGRYIGPCTVLRVKRGLGERIYPADLGSVKRFLPRVLIATESFLDVNTWTDDFNSLSPELIAQLAQAGVKLVGIDTPSVDPAASKALESHQALWAHDMSVLEGIWLKGVPVGEYFLAALPLAIEGGDASPVRAALWPLDHQF